jgi:hypothetical protein
MIMMHGYTNLKFHVYVCGDKERTKQLTDIYYTAEEHNSWQDLTMHTLHSEREQKHNFLFKTDINIHL